MKFRTEIIVPAAKYQISHSDKIMMLGSCFVESISSKMLSASFSINVNPFGIVYNPISIANGLYDLMQSKMYAKEELFLSQDVYHSFSHHSRFSGTDMESVLNAINQTIFQASKFLQQANFLIITFGTANVYRLISSGKVVSNCHKLPAKLFREERLTIRFIIEQWNQLIQDLKKLNPNLKILFTVSPIRHWKNGANENQLNKSTLLLAINELVNANKNCSYFPSYEIMLDDLRDYRFYAEDMIHPNDLAINYIWEKFSGSYFSKQTNDLIKEWESILQIFNHKPFNPDSDAHKHFLAKGKKRKDEFLKNNPLFLSANTLTD